MFILFDDHFAFFSVHTELSALATLYLTYLHCRPRGAAGGSQEQLGDLAEGLAQVRRDSRLNQQLQQDGDRDRDGQSSYSVRGDQRGAEDEEDEEDEEDSVRGIDALPPFSPHRQQQQPSQQQQQLPQGQSQSSRRSSATENEAQEQNLYFGGNSGANQQQQQQVSFNSPTFVRSGRPHPSSSPLPRYMQPKGKR